MDAIRVNIPPRVPTKGVCSVLYLEDGLPNVSGDRISPIKISHGVRPFGRGTTRSLGDENDHHGY